MVDIIGTSGNDTRLIGTTADDLVEGRGGNDIIRGSAGFDEIFGDTGSDRFEFSGTAAAPFVGAGLIFGGQAFRYDSPDLFEPSGINIDTLSARGIVDLSNVWIADVEVVQFFPQLSGTQTLTLNRWAFVREASTTSPTQGAVGTVRGNAGTIDTLRIVDAPEPPVSINYPEVQAWIGENELHLGRVNFTGWGSSGFCRHRDKFGRRCCSGPCAGKSGLHRYFRKYHFGHWRFSYCRCGGR